MSDGRLLKCGLFVLAFDVPLEPLKILSVWHKSDRCITNLDEELGRLLGIAFLGLVVDIGNTEASHITVSPFKVINET